MNPNIEETLKQETDKWLTKLEESFSKFSSTGKLTENDLKPIRENIEAYIKDSKFFTEKGDFVRAFEAVVYAWGLLEACQHLGLVKK